MLLSLLPRSFAVPDLLFNPGCGLVVVVAVQFLFLSLFDC